MMKSTISRAAALLKLHKKNRPLCVGPALRQVIVTLVDEE